MVVQDAGAARPPDRSRPRRRLGVLDRDHCSDCLGNQAVALSTLAVALSSFTSHPKRMSSLLCERFRFKRQIRRKRRYLQAPRFFSEVTSSTESADCRNVNYIQFQTEKCCHCKAPSIMRGGKLQRRSDLPHHRKERG